mmetsp:Transcript_28319/g.45367  ORF Transcript_28319/g.45367 Transcript_28319/m.45367 type:complete len:88 (+) Transcript_28319:634-897(+)
MDTSPSTAITSFRMPITHMSVILSWFRFFALQGCMLVRYFACSQQHSSLGGGVEASLLDDLDEEVEDVVVAASATAELILIYSVTRS